MTKALPRPLKSAFIIPLLLAVLLSSLFPVNAQAAYNGEVDFESDIVYMISLDQGTDIFRKNSTKKTPMGSLTKITTALVVLDNEKDLDKKVTVTQKELDELAGTYSMTANLRDGEVLTIRQLLSLILIYNANDAAVVLAHEVSGSTEAFVKKMNQFAKDRGCTDTNYKNPHGLDASGHYTTAQDLAKILKYGLKNETFKKMVSQPKYELPKTNKRESTTTYTNANSLLANGGSYYYSPCRGIKAGSSDSAGYCLASYAVKNGYTYLCIVISGPKAYASSKTNVAFKESIAAYKWTFDNIKLKVVAQPSDIVAVVHVNLGKDTDHVRLVPEKEVTALIPSSVDASGISLEVIPGSVPEDLHAPLKEGKVVGKARVLYAGEQLTTVNLVAAESVHQSFFGSIGYYIGKFFKSKVVRVILILAILAGIFIYLINYLYKKQDKASRVNTVRVKHDIDGEQPIRLVSNDYGAKSKQPQQKKKSTAKKPNLKLPSSKQRRRRRTTRRRRK